MINRPHRPVRARLVTCFAHVAGVDVVRRLAARIGTVMAADAVAGDSIMIKTCRRPRHRRVARAALRRGG